MFAKLQKATVSFGMPFGLSIRMEQLSFQLDGFSQNLIFESFENYFAKIQFSLKSDNNSGYKYKCI